MGQAKSPEYIRTDILMAFPHRQHAEGFAQRIEKERRTSDQIRLRIVFEELKLFSKAGRITDVVRVHPGDELPARLGYPLVQPLRDSPAFIMGYDLQARIVPKSFNRLPCPGVRTIEYQQQFPIAKGLSKNGVNRGGKGLRSVFHGQNHAYFWIWV